MAVRRAVVGGQRVDETKAVRSRELRRGMTPEERTLWESLRSGQINGLRFRRQQVIEGFIVDFYCPAAALVVEVDGEIHRSQAEYDTERDTVLAARGLRVLRISNSDVRTRLRTVLGWISDAASAN